MNRTAEAGRTAKRATPDMSRSEFNAALKRRGFRQVLMWFQDTTGQVPDTSYGGILHRNGKLARRATLAHIIRERDKDAALAAKGAK